MVDWQRKDGVKRRDRPEKILAIWSESTIYGANQRATRGLGGRIYLFNRNHQPVKADGELIVYGFDDSKQDGESVEADRKYVITAQEFGNHFSASEFGPSYSVWIPWDQVGGQAESISVVPVFRASDGQAIVGEHSRNLLSGSDDSPAELAHKHRPPRDQRTNVQPVTYEDQFNPTGPEDDTVDQVNLKSSTIRLPASMRQRVLQPGNVAMRRPTSTPFPARRPFPDALDLDRDRHLPAAAITDDPTANPYPAQSTQQSIRHVPTPPQVPASRAVGQGRGQPGWQRDRVSSRPDPARLPGYRPTEQSDRWPNVTSGLSPRSTEAGTYIESQLPTGFAY
jgi:hypothetical protein